MAGDWIKMRVLLASDPKVVTISDYLADCREFMDWLTNPVQQGCKDSAYEHVTRNVTVCVTVASLLRVWGIANECGKVEGDDLVLHHTNLETIGEIAGVPMFGEAMAHVGWAVHEFLTRSEVVRFPGFMIYNTPADDRVKSLNAERQKRYRDKQKSNVTNNDESGATRNVTRNAKRNAREEKRREDKKDLSAASAAVAESVHPEPRPRSEVQQPRDALWEAIKSVWGLPDATKAQASRIGKLVTEFKALGAKPEDLATHRKRVLEAWGAGKDTPEATSKHWSQFNGDVWASGGATAVCRFHSWDLVSPPSGTVRTCRTCGKQETY